MLSRRSVFLPKRRYLVFGFLLLLSWCLFTLPHLWFAHPGSRAVSGSMDAPRQTQITKDSAIALHSSSSVISEAKKLPRHDETTKKYANETRGNSDVLSVDNDSARNVDIPIKVNNNNEFDNQKTNRNDGLRVHNSGIDVLAIENNGFARGKNINSEGRRNDVVANSRLDVPKNGRNVILVTGNSGLDLASGDKNRKDFPNNENAESDFFYTGNSKSKGLDHESRVEDVYNKKTNDNDLPNNGNNKGESGSKGDIGNRFSHIEHNRSDLESDKNKVFSEENSMHDLLNVSNSRNSAAKTYSGDEIAPKENSRNEHVSNEIIENDVARDGTNGNEFTDDDNNRDRFLKHENKDDDFLKHDVHRNIAFIERENNRNAAVVESDNDKDKIPHERDNSGEFMPQAGSNMKDDLFRKENAGYEVLLGDRNSAKDIGRNGNSRNDVIVMDTDNRNAAFDDKDNMFHVLRHHQDVLNGKAEGGHPDESEKENIRHDGRVRNHRLGNDFSSNHEHNRQDALARGREDSVASNGESRSITGHLREPEESPVKFNGSLPGIPRKGYDISVYDEVLGKFVFFSTSDSTQHSRNNWFPNERQAANNHPVVQNYNEDNSKKGYGIMSDITNRDQHNSDHNRSIPEGLTLKTYREISLDTNYDEDERQEYVPRYKEKPAPSDTQINVTERFPWKPLKAEGVDCSKLFAGDESELRLAQDIQPPAYNTTDLIRDASSCSDFVARNGFITSPLTSMERDFPIAYSILVYKDPAQVVDLLGAIYRPQNYYCLHVDSHTKSRDQDAFRAIAKCFHNVFLSSRSARVMWGQFGVLQAEVFCMEDLYQYPDWRYFINLTGQEFPLKTNYEIVKILQALRGANDVLVQNTWKFMERWCRYLPAPHNLTIYKGSVHIAVSRPFVRYVLTSPVANDFLHWIRPIKIPDEVFFNTLNHNPDLGVPGSYNGPYVWRNYTHKPHLSRFKNWSHTKHWRCAGRKYVRAICILSAGDLPLLDARPELFANKFYYAYSNVARQCLTEKLYNRTRQETLGTLSFDVTYYENLPFLRHIVRGPEP